ncbi:TRAP transporter large permease [Pelagibius sp.]|uniref:TRAP transporter large permease n=1 Tax=Pelagibius sp. TaxID=1931238 RepID=UPI00263065EA|nr:TRAP transporter large permease [Pelagibius sp.]
MILAIFAVLFGLIFLGVPIAVALAISAGSYFVFSGVPVSIFIQQLTSGAGSFPLLAIPFFILAGVLMSTGGIARRLIDFANKVVGFMWGGLAQVSIVGSMFFAGVSGSSAADSAVIGNILIPEMERKGYTKGFAVAINAASSTVGIIIPPSIPMVIYAWMADVSVGRMFLAGFVPGLLFGLIQMVVTYILAKRGDFPREPVPTVRSVVTSFRESFLALLFPVLVLGGIVAGVVTPTEAGVVAVFYAFLLGIFVYRDMTMRALPGVLLEATYATGAVMLVIGAATTFSWILAVEQIPGQLVAWFNALEGGRVLFLLFVNVICLFLGTFIGGTGAAIILITPILLPVATALGIDPVHLGIIMIANLAIGLFTPPVGSTLFISCRIAEMPILTGFKHCVPFFFPLVGVLILITYAPEMVLIVPRLFLGP